MLYVMDLCSFAFSFYSNMLFLIGAHYCFVLARVYWLSLQEPGQSETGSGENVSDILSLLFQKYKRILFVLWNQKKKKKKIFKSCKIQMEF